MRVAPGHSAPRVRRSASRRGVDHGCHARHFLHTSVRSTVRQTSTRVLPVDATTFEPRIDPAVLASQLVVLATTAAAGCYWWLVVVPSERGSLARSKRRGPLNEYLDGLESDTSRGPERWFYSEWLGKRSARRSAVAQSTATAQADKATSDAQPQEAGLMEPPLKEPTPNPDLMQPAFNSPTPSFWSLDNPIMATMVGLGACAAVAAVVSH
jgi:hypothetical protein